MEGASGISAAQSMSMAAAHKDPQAPSSLSPESKDTADTGWVGTLPGAQGRSSGQKPRFAPNSTQPAESWDLPELQIFGKTVICTACLTRLNRTSFSCASHVLWVPGAQPDKYILPGAAPEPLLVSGACPHPLVPSAA